MKTMVIQVRGKVQGVFFRQSVKEKAIALGVNGTVCNLRDGSVEISCTGSAEQLESLIDWCHEGPPKATVTAVECTEKHLRSFNGFTIIH